MDSTEKNIADSAAHKDRAVVETNMTTAMGSAPNAAQAAASNRARCGAEQAA